MRWVGNLGAAFIAQLRGVSRVHGYDPAAVLSNIVGEPLNQLSSVPPAVLHRVRNPAQIFHGHNRVAPQVGEVGYLLCRENR